MQALAFYLFAGITLGSALMVVTARNPIHSIFYLILAFFSTAGLFVLLSAEFLAMILIVVYVGAVVLLFLSVIMMLDIPIPQIKSWFLPNLREGIAAILSLTVYCVIFLISFLPLSGIAAWFVVPDMSLDMSSLFLGIILLSSFVKSSLIQGVIAVPLFALTILSVVVIISQILSERATGDQFTTHISRTAQYVPVGFLFAIGLLAEFFVLLRLWKNSPVAEEMTLAPMPPDKVVTNTHALGKIIYTDYLYAFQASGIILLIAMMGAIILILRRREGVKKQDIGNQVNRNKLDSLEIKNVKVGEGIE